MRRRRNPSYGSYRNRGFCENPWNGNCENRDVVVFIEYKRERRPICRSCWMEIANGKHEWG